MEKFIMSLWVLIIPTLLMGAGPCMAQESLAPLVVQTVETLARDRQSGGRAGGGYDLHKRFTQDLSYAGTGLLRASTWPPSQPRPYKTMCVAAVTEVIVETLNKWAQQHGTAFTSDLPLSRWTNGTRTGVISNIFMYRGTESRGTAFALQRLGLGREKPFQRLQNGDFINFNRANNTGHAVVFMGYLRNGSGTPVTDFSRDVVGFRYFSAQGQGRPDGGFGFRNAYFLGKCPVPRGRNDDCNIIGVQIGADGTVRQNPVYFNTGELLAPTGWRVAAALAELRREVSRGFEDNPLYRDAAARDAAINAVLSQRLEPDEDRFVDGTGAD